MVICSLNPPGNLAIVSQSGSILRAQYQVSVIRWKFAIQQVLDRRLIHWLDEVVVEARRT